MNYLIQCFIVLTKWSTQDGIVSRKNDMEIQKTENQKQHSNTQKRAETKKETLMYGNRTCNGILICCENDRI